MNLVNSKVYIGQSIHIYQRWKEHISKYKSGKPIIYQAMRKYGIENFKLYVLCEAERCTLDELEVCYIQYYHSLERDYGYNILTGGQNSHKKGREFYYPSSKVSLQDVIDIRNSYGNFEKKVDVYSRYSLKIPKGTFNDIWNGKTWKDVNYEVYNQEIKNIRTKMNKDDLKVRTTKACSKISEEDILSIRREKNKGNLSRAEVNKLFSHINKHTFDKIWNYTSHRLIICEVENDCYEKHKQPQNKNCGEASSSAKLTQEEVCDIRKMKKLGYRPSFAYENSKYKEIISFSGFYAIWQGRNWKDVECEGVF